MMLHQEQMSCTGRAPWILAEVEMLECGNPSCDRTFEAVGRAMYCSQLCREMMRNDHGHRFIARLQMPMSTWWKLVEKAEVMNMDPIEYLSDLIDTDLGVE